MCVGGMRYACTVVGMGHSAARPQVGTLSHIRRKFRCSHLRCARRGVGSSSPVARVPVRVCGGIHPRTSSITIAICYRPLVARTPTVQLADVDAAVLPCVSERVASRLFSLARLSAHFPATLHG
ncbi:hypothetical protein C8Q77DRAFT_1142696 [Trametes polyzona]|nr:hypothetical protein C8Q77DRAFT_1142696 [Trametes polyzona]